MRRTVTFRLRTGGFWKGNSHDEVDLALWDERESTTEVDTNTPDLRQPVVLLPEANLDRALEILDEAYRKEGRS